MNRPNAMRSTFEQYGVDIAPEKLATLAHASFTEIQGEMKAVAQQIAKERKLPSSDYRDIIRDLKKKQLVGDAILPFYEDRLKQIEKIIVDQQIVKPAVAAGNDPHCHCGRDGAATGTAHGSSTVPAQYRSARRICFAAEYSRRARQNRREYDDFTFDAAAWTLTAHEARPGHELQFDSMLEHGVSLARVRYAFN